MTARALPPLAAVCLAAALVSCGGGEESSAVEKGGRLSLRESARLACGDSGRRQARIARIETADSGRARRLGYSAAGAAWPCEAILLPAGEGYAIQLTVAAPQGEAAGSRSDWCAEVRPPGVDAETEVVAEFAADPGEPAARAGLSDRQCVPVPSRVADLDR